MSTSDSEYIQFDQFQNIRSLMGEEFPTLVEAFREDASTLIDELGKAHATGEAADMVRPAHSLKSTAASLGFEPLSRLSAVMEQQSKAGELPGETELNALNDCLLATFEALDSISRATER